MFTVVIAEKKHIDAIQKENKLFFEPFLDNKELVFCGWDTQGQKLQNSVPGLSDAVGRHREWRAVIINSCAGNTLSTRNPFDLVDHSSLSELTVPNRQPEQTESLEDWEKAWNCYYEALASRMEDVYKGALEYPLVRLTTWLCFRPEDYILNDVQEKQDVHDWAMEMLGRDDLKTGVKLELMERNQYKNVLQTKEKLRRDFVDGGFLNVAYPTEVYCISPRTVDNSYFDPGDYWTIRQDSEYSSFADRNMYFDRMRFMVFDILGSDHRNYRTDYIRFLASVLIFASNPVPGSAMQARHLYRLEVDTDDAPLYTMATSYDRKLSATYDVIESEMERIRSEIPGELTDKAAEALFCKSKDVVVQLDESCNSENVFAEKGYGLFFDSPENEYHKWTRDYLASQKEIAYITRQQSRSVRKSVGQLHLSCELSGINASRLTPFQIDDIREYTDIAENEMVESIPPDFTDLSGYSDRMKREAENVKKILRKRMTKKTVMILASVFLGLYLACFLPFLFSNNNTPKTITAAVVLSSSMCVVQIIIMLISLFILRFSVVRAVRNYNNLMHELMGEIRASMKSFSKYLSASCNVRRGHAVQNYARENIDVYTKSLRIRKKHQEDIRRLRAQIAENYGDYIGDRSYCDEAMCHPFDYDYDQTEEYKYPAPFLAGDCRQIEFISNGNYVTVPSSYVTRILVRMEGIYES